MRGDQFGQATRDFLRRVRKAKHSLILSDVAYAELYAGISLAQDPGLEERRVQRLLAVNRVEVRMAGSLEVAKRAGKIYGKYLEQRGEGVKRILPDFLIGASAELYASKLVTWNPEDFRNYLKIEVSTPAEA